MLFPIARTALFALDAERAHRLTITMLAAWSRAGTPFAPRRDRGDADLLATTIAGIRFGNPVGLAAGVDKDAEALRAFLALGFGFVEAGTLTLRLQSGNPRPRLFRLAEDRAVINRMGFNNGGLEAALPRADAGRRFGTVGINVGANKDSTDRVGDYARAVALAVPHADYVTINISSPNTPGLRDLQRGSELRDLLAATDAARRIEGRAHPLFLKVAPDLDAAAIDAIAAAAIEHRIDALIVANTTVERPALRSSRASESGGLSGAPLASLSRRRLADFRAGTDGQIPLISVGGIDSADEAYARIRAGASLVQLYTALVYRGPGLAVRLVDGVIERLRRDGFKTVAEAVGAG